MSQSKPPGISDKLLHARESRDYPSWTVQRWGRVTSHGRGEYGLGRSSEFTAVAGHQRLEESFKIALAQLSETVTGLRYTSDAAATEAIAALRIDVRECMAAIAEIRDELQQKPVVRSGAIIDLGVTALDLLQPIQIVLEQYDDEVTASWPEVEAFGAGASDGEALLALKRDIVALYEDLSGTPDESLGELLLYAKRTLLKVIARNEAP